MRDFKDSCRQKHWEHSAGRHARARQALKIHEGQSEDRLTESSKRMIKYWKETIATIEAEYPSLRNHTVVSEEAASATSA